MISNIGIGNKSKLLLYLPIKKKNVRYHLIRELKYIPQSLFGKVQNDILVSLPFPP